MKALLITLVSVFGISLLGCLLTPWFIVPMVLAVLTAFIFVRVRRVPLKKLMMLTFLEELVYSIMNFPGRHLDVLTGVVSSGPGPSEHWYRKCPWIFSWRKWVFYLAWFVKPVRYEDHNEPDGFGDGIYVDLSDHFVAVQVPDAETRDIPDPDDPKKVIPGPAASFIAQGPGAVINPALFVIGSGRDVFKRGVEDQFTAFMKSWARTEDESGLLSAVPGNQLGQIGHDLLDAQVNAGAALDVIRNRWGFKLPPETITIKDVTFSARYQQARQDVREAAMRGQAKTAEIYNPVKDAIAAGIPATDAVRLRVLDMGATVADLNVHSGGQSINPSTLVLGQSGAGILVGDRGSPHGGGRNPKGGNPRGSQNRNSPGPASDSDATDKEAADAADLKAAEDHFQQYHVWPTWDPKKRKPN